MGRPLTLARCFQFRPRHQRVILATVGNACVDIGLAPDYGFDLGDSPSVRTSVENRDAIDFN